MPIKNKILVAFLAVFALLGTTAGAEARTLSSSEASLLQTMNGVRASHRLAPLRLDVRLLRAARGHSADMLHRQYFAHGSVAGRALAQGARGPVFGEDLAWGTGSDAQPEVIVQAWMDSPPHRRIMLDCRFSQLGVGIAAGRFGDLPSATVYVADFAA